MSKEIEVQGAGTSAAPKIDANMLAKIKHLEPLLALFVKSLLERDLAEKVHEATAKRGEDCDSGNGASTS